MNKTTSPSLWIFLSFVIILGIVWQLVPLSNAQDRVDALPLVGAEYGGKTIPLTDFEKNFFYRVDILKRLYDVDDHFLYVLVLDGTNNRHIVHDPYYCFKGSGWEILDEREVSIPHGHASLVKIRKGDEEKEAMFWFGNGTENYASPLRYWLATTLRRLSLGFSGPEPVLVIVQPVNQNYIDWKALSKQFPSLFLL